MEKKKEPEAVAMFGRLEAETWNDRRNWIERSFRASALEALFAD